MSTIDLILASTSRYRRGLLDRLRLPFRTLAPAVDETAGRGEAPDALALRLAIAKARAVADTSPNAIIIGSDQVADLDGRVLGKPVTAAAAQAQLVASSGREVVFHTALCVIDTRSAPARVESAADATRVVFRDLDPAEIARYVELEQPLDCAGSFKAEGLGISLFERIRSDDPTALVGLPLIALARILREMGLASP